MFQLLYKIIGHPNERKIKQIEPIVDHINDLEPELERLSDDELRAKTEYFRNELANRERSDNAKQDYKLEQEALDLLLPQAFAVVREASKRVLGMRHFDVQMIGGYVLHKGGISEMRTGEGKTLVATLPTYLNALTGKGVHVVTVNDYLAKRDAEWMGQLYNFLGLSVGLVLSEQRGFDSFQQKKQAYAADITYGTNNEFGFDYLRDNMAPSMAQLCQRDYNFAVIDEVDSILIDEARTPLIISGRLEQSAETYRTMSRIAPLLEAPRDYTVDEKARNVILNEDGIDRAQELLNVPDLFDPKTNLAHHLLQALKAKELFKRDIDYVVKDDQCIIVDEFTGRLMEGRRWSDGLHQAVEAKEGVKIQDETQTLASITFQNLFRLYPKLSGMTGTAMTEEAEFGKIYNLEVTAIPTNRSDTRTDHADVIYKTEKVKFYKAIEEIVENYQLGRPVLVGTTSIEKSEQLSQMLTIPNEMNRHLHDKAGRLLAQIQNSKEAKIQELAAQLTPVLTKPDSQDPAVFTQLAQQTQALTDISDFLLSIGETALALQGIRKGVKHHVLNAKHHEQEALIVAQAGRLGGITIATNMAGRGTDILLGGNPEYLVKEDLANRQIAWQNVLKKDFEELVAQKKLRTDADKQKVLELGGLYIIGTERHESRRIDNQLRGRAARQGDPGATKFYLSLEDSLMRIFGGGKVSALMDMLNVDETMPITAGLVSRAIEGAQRKVEAYHFDMRKNILQYDDVLTEQRKLIYGQRRKVLEGQSLRESIVFMIEQEMERMVSGHITADLSAQDMDEEAVSEMLQALHSQVPQLAHIDQNVIAGKGYTELMRFLKEEALAVHSRIEAELERTSQELYKTHGIQLLRLEDEDDGVVQTPSEPPISSPETNPLRRVERDILLSVIDSKWIDYLHGLDSLREGIGLRAYGQKDPLIEYKREAFEMFQNLTYEIQHEAITLLFRARVEIQLQRQIEELGLEQLENSLMEMPDQVLMNNPEQILTQDMDDVLEGELAAKPVTAGATPSEQEDLCPCGSGKKFKKCHGA